MRGREMRLSKVAARAAAASDRSRIELCRSFGREHIGPRAVEKFNSLRHHLQVSEPNRGERRSTERRPRSLLPVTDSPLAHAIASGFSGRGNSFLEYVSRLLASRTFSARSFHFGDFASTLREARSPPRGAQAPGPEGTAPHCLHFGYRTLRIALKLERLCEKENAFSVPNRAEKPVRIATAD